MHKLSIMVHSCNSCCNGRAINITYSEQVSHILLVALQIQNTMHMHHIIIRSVSGYTVFFHVISQMA
jgi:C4-type Zn-finger protein